MSPRLMKLSLAALLFATVAGSPAFAATHRRHVASARHPAAASSDHMADQLNAQSLNATQQGQPYSPGAPPAQPAPTSGSRM